MALTVPTAEGAVSLQAAGRRTHDEGYILADGSSPPQASFAAAASALVGLGLQPFQERVYGTRAAREEILESRRSAYGRAGLDPSLPFTYISGAPAGGGEFAGLQVFGVLPREGTLTTVEAPQARGRLWTGPGFRLASFSSLHGAEGPDRAGQADRMLIDAEAALRSCGMAYGRVVRTWIYLAHLLDWYAEFNRVRNGHYERWGLLPQRHGTPPASTAIQGRSGGEECLMDLLALEPGPGATATPILSTVRQPAAPSYGAAFSRGVVLEVGDGRTIHVSGTASIGADGRTAHVDDREGQCVETLLAVGAVLTEHGAGLADICSATLFVKDQETLHAWRSATRLLGIPAFPFVAVRADVCRPDLLVELEAVAIIP